MYIGKVRQMRELYLEPDEEAVRKNAMNTIKLGSKANGFEKKGRAWFVATELQSDIVVEVKGVKFYLHKFPLLSRSGLLNRLVFESRDTQKNRIQLDGVPGGPETFELAAKFCYGMPVDMDASNVASLWCAAVYLEMTDDLEEGNLLSKAEDFFNSVVMTSWKDSITVLNSCIQLCPWSEKLLIVQRCIESIAWKACTDSRGINQGLHIRVQNTDENSKKHQQFMKEWWFDDVLSLPVQYFTKVMMAIKVKGIKAEIIAGAIALYALNWLPRKTDIEYDEHNSLRNHGKTILEQIVIILPRGKDLVPSRFLMHLIRMAQLLDADSQCRTDLEQRAAMQLQSSTLSDLLVPDTNCDAKLDIDLVHRIVQFYVKQEITYAGRPSVGEKVRVANLVDSYLAEVSAQDRSFTVSKFKALAQILPDSSRPSHDGLYAAIDIFLKVHTDLKDEERKELCQLMDCKRLSLQSSMHAAQNERLPLRTVMQVLFFEHLKMKDSATPFNQRFSMDTPRTDGCAGMQQEIRAIRSELEQIKAEFMEFQKSFREIQGVQRQEQKPPQQQKSVVVSKLKKLIY